MKILLPPIFTFRRSKHVLLLIFLLIVPFFFSCANKNSTSPDQASVGLNLEKNEQEIENQLENVKQMGNQKDIKDAISSGSLDLFQKDSVSLFYEKRNNQPAWNDSGLRSALIDTLRTSKDQGLYFEDYHGEEIFQKNKNIHQLSERELSEFDVLLSDAFLKFGDHLLNGKTDPRNIHKIWDTPKNTANKLQLLEKAIEANNLEVALKKLRPIHPMYSDLVAASKEYKKLQEEYDRFEKINKGDLIKPGMEDVRLPEIQSRLQKLGYLQSSDSTATKHTENIQQAIKKLQKENGVTIDGIIGNNTIELLNKGFNLRYEQILVNLERWRWYSRELGDHYIIANIANYWLHVVKNNDTVKENKIMVGVEGRRTPVFSEKIEYLVFNPTWTLPPTILNEDVIPGMRKNKNFLANRNINIYNHDGVQVDPSQIDWSTTEPKGYIYRQGPGASNPLGRVKFMYPNKYLIYLHDTPSQALFQQNVRTESSGCVRVENAVDLAKYLLSDQEDISPEDVETFISSGKTKRVNMEQDVRVHHFYWTAWREDGETFFTEDIYNYDRKTYEALQKAS